MQNTAYTLRLIEPGGTACKDITQLVQSIAWCGDVGQAARSLDVALAVPRDGSIERPNLDEGCALQFAVDGEPQFTGQVVSATTSTQTVVVDLSALDGGRFLVGNQGWYSFSNTPPERAARQICADFGIPAGAIAAAGVAVSRKFPGVALDDILLTLYTLAGETSGKRYFLRFNGEGALEVREKAAAPCLELTSTMGVTNTWDIQTLCNRVEIRTDSGRLVRVVEDRASQTRNGTLQQMVTQRDGEDSGAKARALLEDHALQQSLTVELLDPPLTLKAGEAVTLRDTGSGVSGLFWIDADTHTWKNGNHYGKFKLNLRNIMQDTTAGREPD